MPTRNVVLTDHQQALIEELVQTGRHQHSSEVLREGLRMVERREAADVERLKALQAAVELGWRDIDEGRYVDVQLDDLDDYLAELGRSGPART